MAEPRNPQVLITGFGPFLNVTTNPSYEIVRRLRPTIAGENILIDLINVPSPIPARYHDILDLTTKLVKESQADIVLHMGLAHGRTWFAVERGAERDRYHEVPDEARRVFTRAESKKAFGKEPARLESSLNLESAVEAWREDVRGVQLALGSRVLGTGSGKGAEAKLKSKEKDRGKSKEKEDGNGKGRQCGEQVDVRLSDDVGNYVCGFQYYVSLLERQKITEKRDTLFFHVPYLESEEEIAVGVRVTEGLIRALVGVYQGQ